ncbi:type II secretion system protein [Candidatus Kaiserbacteria bacterium]|nr:type II secretion system protein [Candidatus Kaiserbacteria bacterium]
MFNSGSFSLRPKKERGFTLIELLVVIAIIGLLSSVVLASLNNARKKGRDARRLSDLKQLQTSLELYYSDNNAYPSATSALAPDFIPAVPTDPGSGGAAYTYVKSSDSNYFCLGATFENTPPSPVDTCNGTTLGATEPTGNYRIGP